MLGRYIVSIAFLLALPGVCGAGEVVVEVPGGETISVASAVERGSAVIKAGKIDESRARFTDIDSAAVYDLAIEEKSGALLCGSDMSWCDASPADPQAEAIGDDDREAIRAIVQDIKGFANKPSILTLAGDHDRAVALVNLVRDNGFHSNTGGEVIWRVEVWFFKWQNGGWERVANQSRLLRRERFASHAEYQKQVERVRWVPQLGGVHLGKGETIRTITLNSPTANGPATRASGSAADMPPSATAVH